MAGTIPLSMTQQLDEFGEPLAGGHLYLIEAGTVSTPQNGFQDSALTLPWPNPIILDASGRLPQFFLADGSIKVRLTDVLGNVKLVADGILVTGASSGGGGGSPVDATTVLTTGDVKARYGTGVHTGFVRANGRTLGSATSGATERANADAQPLFEFLWNGDANLSVSTGRGVSSVADWSANKTIALPDGRGRGLAGLDDMGNTSAARLLSAFGAGNVTLGAATSADTYTLTTPNLPAYTPAGSVSLASGTVSMTTTNTNVIGGGIGIQFPGGSTALTMAAQTFTGTAQGGTSSPVVTVQPTLLVTLYIKL